MRRARLGRTEAGLLILSLSKDEDGTTPPTGAPAPRDRYLRA